jgi:hypothetical protein
MPRIRTIKPDHWEEEDWNLVSLQSHLLFLGMKNFADDKGVIKDNPVLIKNKVFPTREDIRTNDIKKWLAELSENSFLIPLEFEKKGYYVMDFSNEKIDKPQPSILPDSIIIPFINTIRERSRIVSNTPAVEESSSRVDVEGIGGVKDIFTHDSEFENLILGFWGFSEIRHFPNFKKFRQACVLFDLRDEYEYFKSQCKNYKIYTELIGLKFKHTFENFLGQQEIAFEDGAWNKENWELKITEEKEKSSGKKENKGTIAVIEAFSQNILKTS